MTSDPPTDWEKLVGKQVTVYCGGEEFTGTLVGVEPDGCWAVDCGWTMVYGWPVIDIKLS